MISNYYFGHNRNILIDIRNKFVHSNTEDLIIKPDEVCHRYTHTDANRNEVITPTNLPKSPKVDYDCNDKQNTSIICEFFNEHINEISDHMFELEKFHPISKYFLENSSHSLIIERSRLINSIVKIQSKFNANQEVLFYTTQIIDRYLDRVSVEVSEMTLLIATAFFIGSKYDKRSAISVSNINKLTANAFKKSDIIKMEEKIFNTLDFWLSKPIPLEFLRRITKKANIKYEEHTLAKYFLEISILDFGFSTMQPSFLASSALCLAFKIFENYEWDSFFESISTYTFKDLRPGMQKIAQMVLKVGQEDYEFKETWKKFSDPKLLCLSTIPELTGSRIKSIANGIFN